MRLEKMSGFVVYSFPLGEADQITSCFTSAGNLVKFVAKGSRKMKSKFAAAVQLFILGEYVIYCGKGLPILRQADIIDSFSPLRQDWAKSGAAFAVMELSRLLVEEEARETKAFRLVMAYMLHLKSWAYDPIVFDSFRLQLAASLGYEMGFSHCAQCGSLLESGWLDWSAGGAVCNRCRGGKSGGIQLGPRELTLLQAMGQNSFSKLQGEFLPLAPIGANMVNGLINWLTQGKTKAQAFRSLFEG